ncbi:MAG: YihY/virulence factor BrkB family protein [Bacteroidetes bacterium]|nr:YihY/virulence factor BrkB family protein [Bacteroidota bacterium]
MRKILEKLQSLIKFFERDIWKISLKDMSPRRSFLFKQARIIVLAFRGFTEDKVQMRASALTYFTLLSIVPVFALAFGIAKGFGLDQVLERELLNSLTGKEEVVEYILSFSDSLLKTTSGGMIAGIGLLILLYTVMQVLSNIESSFNDIWQIKHSRTLSRKLSDYFAMMFIAPVFLIFSNGATVYISTQIISITEQISILGFFSPVIMFFIKLIPYFMMWILLIIVYMVMPNTNVKFGSALVAAIIAGTLLQLVQWGYVSSQIGVTKYNAIYGSFAALPLLLIWMQVSWLVILFGAEISFANQNVEHYEFEVEAQHMSPYNQKLLALMVMNLVSKKFDNGEMPLTATQIAHHLDVPMKLTRKIIDDLQEVHLLSKTQGYKRKDDYKKVARKLLADLDDATFIKEERIEKIKEEAFQPAIDINKITVKKVLDKLEHIGLDFMIAKQTEELIKLKGTLDLFNSTLERLPSNKLVKDI